MTTRIARITVGPHPDGGHTATCGRCTWSVRRPTRLLADVAAHAHQRRHVTPDPEDQITSNSLLADL